MTKTIKIVLLYTLAVLVLSCAEPPPAAGCDSAVTSHPYCEIPAGYVVFGQGCGGPQLDGLTCATGCVVVDVPDGGYPVDAGRVPLAIGCRLPRTVGGGGVCVSDCSDCQ
jgi:hypothetical protein